MLLKKFKLNIKSKLVLSFILIILIPLAGVIGFYFLSFHRMMSSPYSPSVFQLYSLMPQIADELSGIYERDGELAEMEAYLFGLKLPEPFEIKVYDIHGVLQLSNISGGEESTISVMEMAEAFVLPRESLPERYHSVMPLNDENETYGFVVSSLPYELLSEPMAGIWRNTLLVGLFLIALTSLVAGLFLARNILKPLKALTLATEKVAGGELSYRVQTRNQDELGRLAESFNLMTSRLEQALVKEKALENSRRQLLANISHDLRTPLSSIRGYVEALQDGIAGGEKKRERYLRVIHDKTLSLERLINDLFYLSQMETGQVQLCREFLPGSDLLINLLQRFEDDVVSSGFYLEVKVPGDLPCVYADKDRLELVLGNLLQNAIDFSPSGKTITVTAQEEGDSFEIKVCDEGPGIHEDDLPHIFERFYTGDQSRSGKNKGTGLGLSIARQIIELHGGEIGAYNNTSEPGSTFFFRLPIIENSS